MTQNDLAAVSGTESRGLLGRGRGVLVGILDGGIDANHPAVRGSVVAARDFSNSRTTDDEPTGTGHATGIAGLYVGHSSEYTGLVYRAGIINARVITSSDYTNDQMSGAGLFYALNRDAKVINLSYGNRLGDGPLSNKFNLMVDYATEAYGASIVSAAGNENDTAVAQVPAGAYNGYSVGALDPSGYTRVSSFSNFALSSDRRTKPDLVAPGKAVQVATANWEKAADYASESGTSYSTPIVGGILAQMIGYGRDHKLSTDPRLLKAITMTSADKVRDSNGDAWSPRSQSSKSGVLRIDRPLDDEQGAGRIDGAAAYEVYSRSRDADTPFTDWRLVTLKRKRTNTMNLGHLDAGQRVDSTLAWYRHVTLTDRGTRGPDAGDGFTETAPIADFALSLLKDGRPVAISNAAYDNFEQLSFRIASAGNYALEVYRSATGGIRNETVGFATRVLDDASTSVFRSLSESEPATLTPQATGGGVSRSFDDSAAAAAITAVPEPSAGAVIGVTLAAATVRRRRRAAR